MLASNFTQVNRRLEEERRAKFCGTASISISSLKPTLRGNDRIRRSIPEPLKRLYREEHGCRREDNRHHAKAIISQHDFNVALLNAGVSATRLQSDALPYPRLEIPPGVQLECLQGSDRIMAADEVFDGSNKHWIVDLYLDDLSDELKSFFVDEYEYQKEPGDGEFYLQVSQTAYVTVPGDTATRFDLGCRQLWLAAFREFRELPADVKKQDVLAKARKRADETTLFEFASLANALGFKSDDLSTIMRESPDFEVAKRLLLSARKPEQYRYPDFEESLTKITKILATAQPVLAAEASSSEMNELCVELPNRCGIPRDSHHDRDQAKLFLPNMLLKFNSGQARVSSFFIRRSVYLSYFGLPQSLADFVVEQQPTRPLNWGIQGASPADRMDLDSDVRIISTAQAIEQSKLDQLRELSRKEQDNLDHLRQLAKQEQERLQQLSKSVNNAAKETEFRPNQMVTEVTEVTEENAQHSDGRELVLFDTIERKRDAALIQDVEIRPLQEYSPSPPKRSRIVTQLNFDRVQWKIPSTNDSCSGVVSSSRHKIPIEFHKRQDTGRWVQSDVIHVYASDPSEVERTAENYLRDNYLLFDISHGILHPRTCFNKVTANRTNTILAVPKSYSGPMDYEDEL
ncbi:putative conserved hypothetical protein [Colletotrichum sublineola]|uniref:Uncharacterized protein n=1 Tax=Colletotrichum sublineola TaxID=1173701 RepID=A0A066XM54_COLSU|nr:putative conserved hypothetical protein [Colletotrichum sublineola]